MTTGTLRLKKLQHTNGTDAVTISTTGNVSSAAKVGIGTDTPDFPLDVEGSVADDAVTTVVRISADDPAASTDHAELQIKVGNGASDTATRRVELHALSNNGADGRNLILNPSGGKVGIGTTSPSHPLSVITSTDGTGVSGDDTFVAILQNAEATDDRSYGLKLMAGSTINDQALTVQDHDGTKDMFTIKGNGLHSMYLSSSDNNYVVNANPSVGGAGTKQWNLYYKADSSVFTGYHYYAKKDTTETFSMGDVIVLENGKATKCTKAHATNVVGIISGHPMGGGRWLSNNKDVIATEETAVEVASVGDSQDWNKIVTHYLTGFKVCNENGAIASGDLLCSANKTGYLMKQDGTAITTETVGKSMDDVTFESDGTATGIYGFLYCG